MARWQLADPARWRIVEQGRLADPTRWQLADPTAPYLHTDKLGGTAEE